MEEIVIIPLCVIRGQSCVEYTVMQYGITSSYVRALRCASAAQPIRATRGHPASVRRRKSLRPRANAHGHANATESNGAAWSAQPPRSRVNQTRTAPSAARADANRWGPSSFRIYQGDGARFRPAGHSVVTQRKLTRRDVA
jgi:hypothetical protein